jgi:hypothetical protein
VSELVRRAREALAGRPILRPIERIPFNRPQAVGAELEYVLDAIAHAELASSGRFSERCSLRRRLGHGRHCSCTRPPWCSR